MKSKLLFLLIGLSAAFQRRLAANDIIYQTGFEPPAFTTALPLRGQEDWESFASYPQEVITLSTENPRDGTQCLRWKGVPLPSGSAFAAAFHSILAATDANPLLLYDIRTDIRLDGPQTGTLGTPEQDILSANLFAVVAQPNGAGRALGGFFVSSGGKIWTFGSLPADRYKYSTSVTFGAYHSLRLRVNFIARNLTYFVDGVDLGSSPIDSSLLSERLVSGYLEVFGPNDPINTPELTYNRANYTAYFDNYSLESVPVTPADVAIQFAVTDYAGSETVGAASVNVVRRGYLDSAVRAALNTADGSAVARRDYLPVSTVVAFAAGEREKVVQIPILNDDLVESDEVVNLSLSPLSPAVLLPRPTAPLWILDDERAGSVDPAFHFDAASLGITTVFGAQSIIPLADGKFLAGMDALDPSSTEFGIVARFNADGSPDLEFHPYVSYVSLPEIASNNGDRRLLLNLGDRVLRLYANGKEDSSYNVTTTFGPDPGFIETIALQRDQKVIIAGFFDGVNGVPRQNIARVRVTGEVDSSFNPGADDYISAMALQANGRIVIGGYFQNVGGEPRPFLARLNADGSIDSSFDTGAGFSGFPSIVAIAVQRDGRILVGGFFDTYQGAARSSLVRLMPDGALDASFDTGTGFRSGFFPGPGFVGGLALQADGKILASGGFNSFNGVHTTGVVRLNPDGSLDPAFQLGGTDSFAAEVNAGGSLALLPDGDILAFLSSNVSFIKNEPVHYQGIVRLNGDPTR